MKFNGSTNVLALAYTSSGSMVKLTGN